MYFITKPRARFLKTRRPRGKNRAFLQDSKNPKGNKNIGSCTVEKKYVPTPVAGPVLCCLSHRLAAYLLVVFVGIFAALGFCFNAFASTTSAFHAPSMQGSVETKIMHVIVDALALYFVPWGYVAVMRYDQKGCVLFFYYALFRFCVFVPIFGVQLILGDMCNAQKHGYTWVSKSRPHPMRCSTREIAEMVYVLVSFLVNAGLLKAFYNYWERLDVAADCFAVSEKTGLTVHPHRADDETPGPPEPPDTHLPRDPSIWPGPSLPQHNFGDAVAVTTLNHGQKSNGFLTFADSDEVSRAAFPVSTHTRRLSLPASSSLQTAFPSAHTSKYVFLSPRERIPIDQSRGRSPEGVTSGSPKEPPRCSVEL